MSWKLKKKKEFVLFVYWRFFLLKVFFLKENKVFGVVGEEWEVIVEFLVFRMFGIVKEDTWGRVLEYLSIF